MIDQRRDNSQTRLSIGTPLGADLEAMSNRFAFPVTRAVRLAAGLVLVVLVCQLPVARGGVVVNIAVDQSSYAMGDTVNWTASVTGSPNSGDDFAGFAGMSIAFTESRGETLDSPTIDSQWTNNGYVESDLGSGGPGTLGKTDVFYLDMTTTAIGTANVPIPYLAGSYTVNQPGTHVLSASGLLASNRYLNASGSAIAFDSFTSNSAEFSVVPEPSAILFISFCAILVGTIRRLQTRNAARC